MSKLLSQGLQLIGSWLMEDMRVSLPRKEETPALSFDFPHD
jgi:hypothetical protein